MRKKQLCENELYEMRFGFKERNANFRFSAILCAIVFVIFMARIWFDVCVMPIEVDGTSMQQTLQDEDVLLSYRTKTGYQAERGDVIIVNVEKYPESQGTKRLVKRLIAIEGDKLFCRKGQIYICYNGTENYVPLKEDYAYYGENNVHKNKYNFSTYEVGENEIFFLGDNRSGYNTSTDSRYKNEYGVAFGSNIDRLYKVDDIECVVPAWAIKYKNTVGKLFSNDK